MRFFRSTHLLMCLSFENSVIIIPSQMTLLKWLTFLPGSQAVTLTVLLFWIYLFLLTLVFLLQWLSLHWEILIMLLSQFPLTFHHIHNKIPCFITMLMIILVLISTVFIYDHLRDGPWENIFKLSAAIGITLVDVLQNCLNWFHFLFVKGGLLIIPIDYMIFLLPFQYVTKMFMSTVYFVTQLDCL